MHPTAYLFMFIIVTMLALSYIAKENLLIIDIFRSKSKHPNLALLIESQIFTCLMYFSLGYIYLIEGYMKKISYIYDEEKNTDEEKENKRLVKYNLIIIYVLTMLLIFMILKKIMDKHHNKHTL